jgi:DNA mismatch repair protein MutL
MTSRQIRVLSDTTINQIAAGEVIENPASVVKELVENAVDAGAAHVTIEVLGGGFQLLKVSDDGSGMSPEDAALSLERHATSKIVSPDDLFSLATMGFRGEALASMASISKLRLTTALESQIATELEVEGGKILHVSSGARSRGTTIEVRSLFFNVPARKKFQKCPAACSAEITKVVTQLALAHPRVGFDLMQQNQTHFSLPPSLLEEEFLAVLKRRVEGVLGSDYLSSCQPFHFKEKNYEGHGLIAEPLYSRHNRSGQYLFVNQRPVSCPAISYAIRDAYGTRLASDRHPVYLLHLQIPSSFVDVNVHPQKKEIRLREEGFLKHLLHSSVNAALGGQEICIPEVTPLYFSRPEIDEPLLMFKEEEEDCALPELPFVCPIRLIGLYGSYALVSADSFPLFKTSGVVWVDLPAAEARIHFNELMKRSLDRPLSQGLLLPLSFSFSKAESQMLAAHQGKSNSWELGSGKWAILLFSSKGFPPF